MRTLSEKEQEILNMIYKYKTQFGKQQLVTENCILDLMYNEVYDSCMLIVKRDIDEQPFVTRINKVHTKKQKVNPAAPCLSKTFLITKNKNLHIPLPKTETVFNNKVLDIWKKHMCNMILNFLPEYFRESIEIQTDYFVCEIKLDCDTRINIEWAKQTDRLEAINDIRKTLNNQIVVKTPYIKQTIENNEKIIKNTMQQILSDIAKGINIVEKDCVEIKSNVITEQLIVINHNILIRDSNILRDLDFNIKYVADIEKQENRLNVNTLYDNLYDMLQQQVSMIENFGFNAKVYSILKKKFLKFVRESTDRKLVDLIQSIEPFDETVKSLLTSDISHYIVNIIRKKSNIKIAISYRFKEKKFYINDILQVDNENIIDYSGAYKKTTEKCYEKLFYGQSLLKILRDENNEKIFTDLELSYDIRFNYISNELKSIKITFIKDKYRLDDCIIEIDSDFSIEKTFEILQDRINSLCKKHKEKQEEFANTLKCRDKTNLDNLILKLISKFPKYGVTTYAKCFCGKETNTIKNNGMLQSEYFGMLEFISEEIITQHINNLYSDGFLCREYVGRNDLPVILLKKRYEEIINLLPTDVKITCIPKIWLSRKGNKKLSKLAEALKLSDTEFIEYIRNEYQNDTTLVAVPEILKKILKLPSKQRNIIAMMIFIKEPNNKLYKKIKVKRS